MESFSRFLPFLLLIVVILGVRHLQSDAAHFQGILARTFLYSHIKPFTGIESFIFAASDFIFLPDLEIILRPIIRQGLVQLAGVAAVNGAFLVANLSKMEN